MITSVLAPLRPAARIFTGSTYVLLGFDALRAPGARVEEIEFEKFFKGNAQREQVFTSRGSTLIGDVHPEVAEVAGAITPVPGGVGPLTIAMLMVNTVRAARLRCGSPVEALAGERA